MSGVYDSGSETTLINYNIVEKIKLEILKSETIFNMISGATKSNGKIRIRLRIGKIEDTIEAHVIKNDKFQYDLLIGLDSIRRFKLCQDENLQIHQKIKSPVSVNLVASAQQQAKPSLSKNQERRIIELLDNADIFSSESKYDVGTVKNAEATIKLIEKRYISQKPYCCSVDQKVEIENQVRNLLQGGIIEVSSSPYAAPVTLSVRKKDGHRASAYTRDDCQKAHLCTDYREPNKIVIPEAQPFPCIEDIITKCRDCTIFSVLDIRSAFWSVPLREKD